MRMQLNTPILKSSDIKINEEATKCAQPDLTPSLGCVPLCDEKAAVLVHRSLKTTHTMAMLSPYAWPWMFYHTLILFGAILIYFIFVFFFMTSCNGEQLPRVPLWVTVVFLPLLWVLLPFEIRAMQRIVPCQAKFAKNLPGGAGLWIWFILGSVQGMLGRFELATSLISVSRIWHSASCNDIEKVWDEVRSAASIPLPPLWAASTFAYGFSWVMNIWTFLKFLPAPARGRDWRPKSASGDLAALKPFSINDLLFKYSKEPCSNVNGGFFSITGGRVYVMNSLEQLAEISNARLVAGSLDAIERSIEREQAHKHPGTRRTMAQHIFYDGLRSPCRFVLSTALWLNIKCSLLGIAGRLNWKSEVGESEVDGLLLLSVIMTTCSFAFSLVLSTQSLISRSRRLWPHINNLQEGKRHEQTGEYIRDLSGNKMFEETAWQRSKNKCYFYVGLTLYLLSALASASMVAYAILKLYNEIVTCKVSPWNMSGCVFPKEAIGTGSIYIKW